MRYFRRIGNSKHIKRPSLTKKCPLMKFSYLKKHFDNCWNGSFEVVISAELNTYFGNRYVLHQCITLT